MSFWLESDFSELARFRQPVFALAPKLNQCSIGMGKPVVNFFSVDWKQYFELFPLPQKKQSFHCHCGPGTYISKSEIAFRRQAMPSDTDIFADLSIEQWIGNFSINDLLQQIVITKLQS